MIMTKPEHDWTDFRDALVRMLVGDVLIWDVPILRIAANMVWEHARRTGWNCSTRCVPPNAKGYSRTPGRITIQRLK